MEDRNFYRITKDGKTIEAKNKAEAYEAWDSFGRRDVKVEYVKIWKEYLRDTWHEDVAPVKRLSRRYVDNGRSSSYVQGSPYYSYAFTYGKNTHRILIEDTRLYTYGVKSEDLMPQGKIPHRKEDPSGKYFCIIGDKYKFTDAAVECYQLDILGLQEWSED